LQGGDDGTAMVIDSIVTEPDFKQVAKDKELFRFGATLL